MELGGAEHSMMATGDKLSEQPQRPTHGLVTAANAIPPTLLLRTRQ